MTGTKNENWRVERDENIERLFDDVIAAVVLTQKDDETFGYSYSAGFDERSELIMSFAGVTAHLLKVSGLNIWIRETEENILVDDDNREVYWATVSWSETIRHAIVATTREAAVEAATTAIIAAIEHPISLSEM